MGGREWVGVGEREREREREREGENVNRAATENKKIQKE